MMKQLYKLYFYFILQRLLDDLDDDVSIADKRLKQETEHTKKVRLSAKSASLYCCIAILILILGILILFAFIL